MNTEQMRAWLRLVLTPGLTNAQAQQLLTHIGLPEDIFNASFLQIKALVGEPFALQLKRTLSDEIESRIDATLRWLERTPNAHMVTLESVTYPSSLLESGLAPVLFFAVGDLSLFSRPSISFIGTRHPTAEGCDLVQSWTRRLSEDSDVAVVQTDCEGIEYEALVSVLKTRPERLIWVCSSALASPQIEKKCDFVANKGLVMSTVLPVEASTDSENFDSIQQLWLATIQNFVVIQASLRSRVLPLMREAGDLGREIMAVPGSIHHPLSKGCHQLIKQGAALVEGTDDILKVMKLKNL